MILRHTFSQAVLSRRFRFALRLLRGISGFEGLLSRPMLLQLTLGRVVGQAIMPYLRTSGECVLLGGGAAHAGRCTSHIMAGFRQVRIAYHSHA